MPLSSGKRAIVEFHAHAVQGGHGFFVGNFDEVQDDRLVRAERRAGGDAEQEGITDLAGGAGDSNANGVLLIIKMGCDYSFEQRSRKRGTKTFDEHCV